MLVPQAPPCAPVVQLWLVSRSPAAQFFLPQYVMTLLDLAYFPGLKPPVRYFPEATHEAALLPLDPAAGPHSPRSLVRQVADNQLRWVRGLEVRCQVAALGADAVSLMPVLADGIVFHGWDPDISGDPGRMRASWQEAVSRSLDAIVRDRARASGAQAAQATGPQQVIVPPPPVQPVELPGEPGERDADVGEIARLGLPALAAVFLAVMWRCGYRGEVTRVLLAAFTLFAADRAMRHATGGLALLLALAGSAGCMLIVLRRPRTPQHVEQPPDEDCA
jgi:hypothetical protein